MRLLFAIAKYFPYGGLQRDMLRLALACRDRGAEVHILTGAWEGERPDGLVIREQRLRAWSNGGKNKEMSARLAALKGEFDLVLGFHKLRHMDAYFCGDTCLAERVAREKPSWFRLLPRYRVFLELEKAVFAPGGKTQVMVLTERDRDEYRHAYHTEPERLNVLPPGVETARLAPVAPERLAALRAELGIAPSQRVLLHVSANFRLKGLDRILDSLAAIPAQTRDRAVLVVVGNDDPAPFQRQAERLGIGSQVRFTGARDDVGAFYRLADVMVHPARTEAAGMTLLEATVSGLPVIASGNCGYAAHIERAGSGWVLPVRFSRAALTEALSQALTTDLSPRAAAARAYADSTDLSSLTDTAATLLMTWAAQAKAR